MSFHDRATRALANANLQLALHVGVERLYSNRKRRFDELGHAGDQYRDRARAIREHTLSRIDHYVEQCATQFERAGVKVHYAGDAKEACEIVVQIAKARDSKLAVKMKSMLTEEVHLVPALERNGIEAVETDLGEWILQLAKEKPSHLIVPALHKTVSEVKELFDRELGVDDQVTPEALVIRARTALRQKFIDADLGITGVNFAVAETGTLVLVSNEGNGRLVTAGPPVHVALVPFDKVVPTLGEAATLTKMLVQSAAGRRLTTYVSWITGPRAAGELDGPEELHVVFVDNGRSGALGGALEEALYCIRCAACLNACPVYQRVGGHTYDSVYPGPIGIAATPIVDGESLHSDEMARASSLCGACEEVCPIRIEIPRLILEMRHRSVEAGRVRGLHRMGLLIYAFVITRPWLFRLALRMGRLLSRILARRDHLPLPGMGRWTRTRNLAPLARPSFRQAFARRKQAR